MKRFSRFPFYKAILSVYMGISWYIWLFNQLVTVRAKMSNNSPWLFNSLKKYFWLWFIELVNYMTKQNMHFFFLQVYQKYSYYMGLNICFKILYSCLFQCLVGSKQIVICCPIAGSGWRFLDTIKYVWQNYTPEIIASATIIHPMGVSLSTLGYILYKIYWLISSKVQVIRLIILTWYTWYSIKLWSL